MIHFTILSCYLCSLWIKRFYASNVAQIGQIRFLISNSLFSKVLNKTVSSFLPSAHKLCPLTCENKMSLTCKENSAECVWVCVCGRRTHTAWKPQSLTHIYLSGHSHSLRPVNISLIVITSHRCLVLKLDYMQPEAEWHSQDRWVRLNSGQQPIS